MKRKIAVLLALLLIFALCACAKSSEKNSSTPLKTPEDLEFYENPEATFASNDYVSVAGEEFAVPTGPEAKIEIDTITINDIRHISAEKIKGIGTVHSMSEKYYVCNITQYSCEYHSVPADSKYPPFAAFNIPEDFDISRVALFYISEDTPMKEVFPKISEEKRVAYLDLTEYGIYALAERDAEGSVKSEKKGNIEESVKEKYLSTSEVPKSDFVPSLETVNAEKVKKYCTTSDDISFTGKSYTIKGKLAGYSGSYRYYVTGDIPSKNVSFTSTLMYVPVSFTDDGVLYFDQEKMEEGYKNIDSFLENIVSAGYKIGENICYRYELRHKNDENFTYDQEEYMEKFPSGKEMVEKHHSTIPYFGGKNTSCNYSSTIISPKGREMTISFSFGSWNTVSVSIKSEAKIENCKHFYKKFTYKDMKNGTHATFCDECEEMLPGTYEKHSFNDVTAHCNKCAAYMFSN